MAERLTEVGMFIDTPVYKIKNWKRGEAVDKLAKLEDIMEKYGIESVEELSNALEFATVIEKTLSDYGIQNNEELEELLDDNKYAQNVVVKQLVELQNAKTDRDAWEKACELACDVLRDINYKIYNEDRIDFENIFYQEAKTEGNDE